MPTWPPGAASCAARAASRAGRGLRGPLDAAPRRRRRCLRRYAPADEFARGCERTGLDTDLWWPNGHGDQPLYELTCELVDDEDTPLDEQTRLVGFKHVDWRPCEGAPEKADPWLCAVNGKPIFLQGVNWTPIRPNFADVTIGEVQDRLELYRRLGLNVLRVWGGAVLERKTSTTPAINWASWCGRSSR